ncbi:bifunctional isocitrate dehydrogenase kinase/phosphatase [Spongiibacter sp. KMU-158]|uniref:Isocitrate dehydrogenase kinase/phosphatase n=1 Tax=Spongiibacter pelagi TaxID=2760804 RepID=A0A927C4R5_9GAMM|nr:bifunctional isocitrate dehydrogenase kinase/phosphatase [Spongiibacter pelagi]MBD2859987.1 bifunctional isocitrate dehydrogenase kinase/phosphatase [Spongiibacter pelagi]
MTAVTRRLAMAILNGFDAFFAEYKNITLGAQARFESADWQACQKAMRARLELWKQKRAIVAEAARTITGGTIENREHWLEAKEEFAELIRNHDNFEIAQSFFNSIYCLVFNHEKIRKQHTFSLVPAEHAGPIDSRSILRRFKYNGDNTQDIIRSLLEGCEFNIPWEDLERDIGFITEAVNTQLIPQLNRGDQEVWVEALESLFFRNKAAYLVGRIKVGSTSFPVVLPILHTEESSIYVDTLLHDPDDISILFSFSRSYFMVDAKIPSEYVAFLHQLMPHKEIFELYNAMGMQKHGKTEFYRFAVADTMESEQPYIIAPGIKGMVMLVFTRPDFDYVYKVIKDKFTPPKEMSHEHVRSCYRLVKRWDRGGRMADTQEFNKLAFDRRRFSDELMAELEKEAPSLIEVKGNALILDHVYIERKMIPLNLYLKDCNDEQLYSVMDEYGKAIKQLAAGNLFPGDMLLKNFGVTRHGRVVFYDYDEICPLTDCNFRRLPVPQTEEQEMATQPWYEVKPEDVFPEEFRLFFSGNQRAKKVFDELHSDLYNPDYWCELQEKIRNGYVADVFPYRRIQRFQQRDEGINGQVASD